MCVSNTSITQLEIASFRLRMGLLKLLSNCAPFLFYYLRCRFPFAFQSSRINPVVSRYATLLSHSLRKFY